jgi:hypothetical protein
MRSNAVQWHINACSNIHSHSPFVVRVLYWHVLDRRRWQLRMSVL